jgi:hypothetical protein
MPSVSSQEFKEKEDGKVIEASGYLISTKIEQFV